MNIIIVSLNPADEIFLSKEIKHLKGNHDIIFISRDREQYDNITIDSGEGVKSFIIDDPHAKKTEWYINLFLSVFKPEVWKEGIYLLNNKGFSIFSVKKLLFYSASTAIDSRKIKRIIKENIVSPQEQIILYSYRMNTGALTIIKVKNDNKQAKCIARAHGVDLYEYRQKDNYIPFRRKILNGLTSLYCISSDGKNYVEKYPFKHCKVEVSRLGTKDYGVQMDRSQAGIRHKPLIISCSRISPEKRIEKIIDALALIDDEIQWVHIGGGDSIDALKEYAYGKLKEKANIVYNLAGNMDNNEVINYYKEHFVDAFVNVSSVEGIPVSIMEASSFGIPIIATDVGGTGEIVKNGYNGYLIPADFSDELLASRILSMIKDESDIDQIRNNARKEWEDNYNEERNYQIFADALSGL